MTDEADQVKTSICPGISIKIMLRFPSFSFTFALILLIISYGCAMNKFRAVKIAPFGPSL